MTFHRGMRLAIAGAWLFSAGCTTFREVPRSEYAMRAQRKGVRVETQDGLLYDFDWAAFDADSLTGYRRRDVEGAFDELAVHKIPLESVKRLTTRTVDWYRTGLVGGGVLAGAAAAGLATAKKDDPGGAGGGGRGGGIDN